jgi:hypothetical protein
MHVLVYPATEATVEQMAAMRRMVTELSWDMHVYAYRYDIKREIPDGRVVYLSRTRVVCGTSEEAARAACVQMMIGG